MKINIETIPHDKQRYETVGDYWIDNDGVIQVRISEMSNPIHMQAVILHELFEFFLCMKLGIEEPDIMQFDLEHLDSDEPGDEVNAPYRDEHCFATAVERVFIAACKESYKEYDQACLDLFK